MTIPVRPLGAPPSGFQFQQIPVGFGHQRFDFGEHHHADYFRPGSFASLTGQSSQGFGDPNRVALLCIGDNYVPTAEPDLPIAPTGYYWRVDAGRWVADLWPANGMPRVTATRFIEPYCGGFTTAHIISGTVGMPDDYMPRALLRIQPDAFGLSAALKARLNSRDILPTTTPHPANDVVIEGAAVRTPRGGLEFTGRMHHARQVREVYAWVLPGSRDAGVADVAADIDRQLLQFFRDIELGDQSLNGPTTHESPQGVSSMSVHVRPYNPTVGAPDDVQLVSKKQQDAALQAFHARQAQSALTDTAKWAASKAFKGENIDGWDVAKSVAPALSAIDPSLGDAAQFAVPFLQGLFGDKACDYKNAPPCSEVATYHAPRWDGEDVFNGGCCQVEPGGLSVLVAEHAFGYKKWPGYLERLRAADYYAIHCGEQATFTPAGLPQHCGGISNNTISSVIVPEGWIAQFFDRQGMQGQNIILEPGAYELHKMGWGDRIRSARIRGPWSLHDYSIGLNLIERKPGWITAGMPEKPSRDLVIALILADPRRPKPSLDLNMPPATYTSSYGPGWQSNPGIPQLFMRIQDLLSQQQPATQARMSISRPNAVGVRPLASGKKPATSLDIPPAYRSDVSGPDGDGCIEIGALRCKGAGNANQAARKAADFMRAHNLCGNVRPDGCGNGSYTVFVNLDQRIPDQLLGLLPHSIDGIHVLWLWPRCPVSLTRRSGNLNGPDEFSDGPVCPDGSLPRVDYLGAMECELTARRRAHRPLRR